MNDKREPVPTSVRVSPLCLELWKKLAQKQGLTKAKYLEVAVRRLAAEEGIRSDAESAGVSAAAV
jgi:hypothetical protein